MLPDLSIIVGAYVVTRMLRLILKRDPKEHGVVVAFAFLTIFATVIALFDILTKGADVAEKLPQLTR